jgi:hypothetical protein
MKIKLLALILLTLSFLSCKKEVKEIDIVGLLTSKAWKPSTKNPYTWRDCDKDNIYTFNINQLTIENGANKCSVYDWGAQKSVVDPEIETVDYQLDLTRYTLTFKGITYDIIQITDTKLIINSPLPYIPGTASMSMDLER